MPKYRHLLSEARIYPDYSLTAGPGEVVETDRKLGNDPNFALVKPAKKKAKPEPVVEPDTQTESPED